MRLVTLIEASGPEKLRFLLTTYLRKEGNRTKWGQFLRGARSRFQLRRGPDGPYDQALSTARDITQSGGAAERPGRVARGWWQVDEADVEQRTLPVVCRQQRAPAQRTRQRPSRSASTSFHGRRWTLSSCPTSTPATDNQDGSLHVVGQGFPTWGVGAPWGVRRKSRGVRLVSGK